VSIPTECSNPDCQSRLHFISDKKNTWLEKYYADELYEEEE
jgi:hypothetical protein